MRTSCLALVIASALAGSGQGLESTAAAGQERAAPVARKASRSSARVWYRGDGLAAFRLGYRAWRLGDWQAAKSQMKEALLADPRDQPEANVRVWGAGWISPYVPSYYLCVARCRVDHCSEKPNEILRMIKDADRKLQDEYRRACDKQVECPAGP